MKRIKFFQTRQKNSSMTNLERPLNNLKVKAKADIPVLAAFRIFPDLPMLSADLNKNKNKPNIILADLKISFRIFLDLEQKKAKLKKEKIFPLT
jgi:hypothetical protein